MDYTLTLGGQTLYPEIKIANPESPTKNSFNSLCVIEKFLESGFSL
jgi:hypothetical protein